MGESTQKKALGTALIIIGILVGFGAAQLTIAAQVYRSESDIVQLAKSDEQIRADIDTKCALIQDSFQEERRRTDQRVQTLVEMMGRIADQNTRLIALIESRGGLK